MKIFLVLVMSLLVLSGCTVAPEVPHDSAWVADNLRVSQGDPDKNETRSYYTPPLQWGDAYGGDEDTYYGEGHTALLILEGENSFTLQVIVRATNWKFLDKASFATGQRLPLTVIDQMVMKNGNIRERLSVGLSRSFLMEHQNGFTVKFWGQRGKVLVDVPTEYVVGFLRGISLSAR